MTNAPYGPPTDRWNVNLPAVIGVVFVFLVGVIAWVVVSTSGSDDDEGTAVTTPSTSVDTTATTPTTGTTGVSDTTTPAPMPDLTTVTSVTSVATTVPPTTAAPTTAAPTTAPPPPTTAAGADEGAVLGDLAIAGHPMQAPACDGSYITIIASAVGDDATAAGIRSVLESYPTAEYLRTDQTCPSLNPSVDGEPIYVVYFGPFPFASDACTARADGTPGAYAKQLSDDRPPDHVVDCT
jgi:serine/threonine-protein kinase